MAIVTINSGSTFTLSTSSNPWMVLSADGSTTIEFDDIDGDWLIDDGEILGAENDKGAIINIDGVDYFFIIDGDSLYVSGDLTQAQIEANINLIRSSLQPANNYDNFAMCFARGTMLKTRGGQVDVASVKIGDLLQTRDNGLQAVKWIGGRAISEAELGLSPSLRPIVIRANAMGVDLPKLDLTVSPQHRMFIDDYRAELLFGEPEILVPAKALKNDSTIVEDHSGKGVTYFHILFDKHELVKANGCWSESFHPGTQGLKAIDEAAKDELFKLFPELEMASAENSTCRPALKVSEAALLQ